jgi:hypothetical protein
MSSQEMFDSARAAASDLKFEWLSQSKLLANKVSETPGARDAHDLSRQSFRFLQSDSQNEIELLGDNPKFKALESQPKVCRCPPRGNAFQHPLQVAQRNSPERKHLLAADSLRSQMFSLPGSPNCFFSPALLPHAPDRANNATFELFPTVFFPNVQLFDRCMAFVQRDLFL